VVTDLEAFLAAHPVVLDRAESGRLQLVYRGECLTCPWAQVPGTDEEPNVPAVLSWLVANAQTDDRTDEDLRTLLGGKTHELLMSTRESGEIVSVDQKTVSNDRRAEDDPSPPELEDTETGRKRASRPAQRRRQAGDVTDEQLKAAALNVQQARAPYDEAMQARDALIRRALKQGMTSAHIAREVELTRERISGGIAQKRRTRPKRSPESGSNPERS
jgi:hypothetical protein